MIWYGIFSSLLMSLVFAVVGLLPSASGWNSQDAYMKILGQTPRIVLASLIAYFVGEFSNSFVLAKMKVLSKGNFLWARTIGSTLVGELLDSLIFVFIAFSGIVSREVLFELIISNYIFKTSVEVVFTPFTYWIINTLKKREHEDYFDRKTDFNPFKVNA